MNSELFIDKNIELFMPDGVEYIYNILNNIGWRDYRSAKAKKEGMEVIKKLFELDLIEVFSFGRFNKQLKNANLSVDGIMERIDNVWFVGADFSDFIGMPMFKYKDWYLSALNEAGFNDTLEWREFVNEKIGDLQSWIEEKRP